MIEEDLALYHLKMSSVLLPCLWAVVVAALIRLKLY